MQSKGENLADPKTHPDIRTSRTQGLECEFMSPRSWHEDANPKAVFECLGLGACFIATEGSVVSLPKTEANEVRTARVEILHSLDSSIHAAFTACLLSQSPLLVLSRARDTPVHTASQPAGLIHASYPEAYPVHPTVYVSVLMLACHE